MDSETKRLKLSRGWKQVYYAVFQGNSNGGRHFLRNRRSNRHIVPLYGKFETRGPPFEVPWNTAK